MIDWSEMCCALMEYGPITIMLVSILLALWLVRRYGKARRDRALTGHYGTAKDLLRRQGVLLLVAFTIMVPAFVVLYLLLEFHCEWRCS